MVICEAAETVRMRLYFLPKPEKTVGRASFGTEKGHERDHYDQQKSLKTELGGSQGVAVDEKTSNPLDGRRIHDTTTPRASLCSADELTRNFLMISVSAVVKLGRAWK